MKIKMKVNKMATANEYGSVTMTYAKDSVHDMNAPWQMKLATTLINNGQAESVAKETTKKVVTEMETKVEKKSKSILKKVFGKKK
tara:strand:- start:131 stop:385 length:255 start_codon:yes stop_codon:yes gene_type:complete